MLAVLVIAKQPRTPICIFLQDEYMDIPYFLTKEILIAHKLDITEKGIRVDLHIPLLEFIFTSDGLSLL